MIVHGRVQGVFFRESTRRRAAEVGALGWVRNRADGTLEAVFEGSAEAVAAMLDFCREGPEWARVERLEEFREAPEGLSDFRVR